MTKRRRGSFKATDESGQTHTLYIEVEDAGGAHFEGHTSLGGIASLVTSDGMLVDRIEKGKYVIFDTGVILVSDDPKAP